MVDYLEDSPHAHLDIQFLKEFPLQTRLGILFRFQFPSGKFPERAPVGMGGSLGYQNLAFTYKNSGSNDYEVVHMRKYAPSSGSFPSMVT